MKCAAFNVDFNGVRLDPLGSRSPPYERIKFGYPLENVSWSIVPCTPNCIRSAASTTRRGTGRQPSQFHPSRPLGSIFGPHRHALGWYYLYHFMCGLELLAICPTKRSDQFELICRRVNVLFGCSLTH